jgi:hypothetical protein
MSKRNKNNRKIHKINRLQKTIKNPERDFLL